MTDKSKDNKKAPEEKRGRGRPKGSTDNNKKAPEEKRGRGRPKGSTDNKKIKLKSSPRDAKQLYKRAYGDIGIVAVYGVDEYTTELVRYLWKDPSQEFVVTDPVDQRAANLTREVGALPYSIFRYESVHHVGFLESGMFPVIVCTKEYYQELLERNNPHGVKIVCLEDI